MALPKREISVLIGRRDEGFAALRTRAGLGEPARQFVSGIALLDALPIMRSALTVR